MLKISLLTALYSFASASEADLSADHHDTSHQSGYCCTANVAMSNTFLACEGIMTQFSDPADQEYYCFNGRKTGTSGYFGHVNTCKYVPCSEVGYCIGKKDEQFYDDMLAWEATSDASSLSADNVFISDSHGAKTVRPPKPTRAPKPARTPRPTMLRTPRPTKLRTSRPTKPARTPRPTIYMTPRPTVDRTGVDYGDRPLPLRGCAEIMGQADCYADNECVWKFGYPPMALSEDEEYQYVNGWNVHYLDHMNASIVVMFGIAFVALFAFAFKMCSDRQKAKELAVAVDNLNDGMFA